MRTLIFSFLGSCISRDRDSGQPNVFKRDPVFVILTEESYEKTVAR